MAKSEQPKIMTKKHLARVERERRQNRWIVLVASVVLFIVVALIGYGILDQTVLQKNKPVVRVGEDVVTVSEFQKQVSYTRAQKIREYNFYSMFAASYGTTQFDSQIQSLQTELDTPTAIGSQVLQDLTEDLLIRQEAASLGITVTEEEIDLRLQQMYGFYPDGTPTPSRTPTAYVTPTYNATQLFWQATRSLPTATETATPEVTATIDLTPSATLEPTATFTATIEATATLEPSATTTEIPATPTSSVPTATSTPEPTSTPYTLEGYMQAMANYLADYKAYGFTQEDYRRTIESLILREKLTDHLSKEAKRESTQVWARHILVGTLEEAETVLERLKAGEDFYDLAAELSIDTSNKDSGGDLGWFGRNQMVEEFEKAAFALSVGDTSEPVATNYGFHIIQLLGKQTIPMSDYEWETEKSTYLTDFLTAQQSERTDIETFDLWMDVVPSEPTIATFGREAE
jgi:peptidyl-prolyl cis-trans isomerase D